MNGSSQPADPVVVDSDARGVARLTVGTGRKRNALGSAGWQAVAAAAAGLAEDRRLRAVVVAGRGDNFCAGSDLAEWLDADLAAVDASFEAMEAALQAVEALPVPVVAAVRGVAAGAGCELALAADVRLAEPAARIGMPIARLGILLSDRFAGRLSHAVGASTALELLYTGRLLDAPEAQRRGLITEVAAGDLDAAVEEFLQGVVAQPAVAVRAAKQAVLAERRWSAGPGHSVNLPALHEAVARFFERKGLAS